MNSLFQTLLKATVVVLYTTTFSPVQANKEKSIFHPSVVYTVSILSDDQRTDQDTFIDTFVQLVYESDSLMDLFDLSKTPAIEYTQHAYKHFVTVLASLGARKPEKIADFSTRPMAQNFNVFTREEMVRVYSSVAASYLDSQGILTQDNAKDLANQYANTFEKSANETVVEDDPTSKFEAVGNGLMEFLMSVDTLTVEKGWVGAIYYESEWLLTAAETPASRDLFVRCSAEANGDPN
ncbi:uncharacterized protein TNCT_108561 [Trichonephila clavata]|uniref:Uncharacterized protein n=1 Tax=Trichonephila clavata TaxID=2740835 RepID=A0A8X6I0C4_TRICU|nr:uncharacterized protein TNCT_108561 [Trichonephila clavata]